MQFSVYNTTEHANKQTGQGGIGLDNVKKRLNILYPGKHQVSITEKKDWFGIDLTLSLYK